jgi:hypothetical protein
MNENKVTTSAAQRSPREQELVTAVWRAMPSDAASAAEWFKAYIPFVESGLPFEIAKYAALASALAPVQTQYHATDAEMKQAFRNVVLPLLTAVLEEA